MKMSDLKVMVVDDTAVSRGLITQALDWMQVEGYRTCASAVEALESLKKRPAHIVISDYNMPEMDGLKFLQNIRSDPNLKGMGFVLVTGRLDASIVDSGKKFGVNNILKKPFSRDDLKLCINKVVG